MRSGIAKKGSSQALSPSYQDCLYRLQPLRRWLRAQRALILYCTAITLLILLFPLYYSFLGTQIPSKLPVRSREAYATFLSDIKEPWYGVSTRLLTFQIKNDPLTMDPDRDFVVLTTSHIPLELEDQLRREGATVERRELIRGMPGELDPYGTEQWKDQYSKLHIFNLTMYERILFLDNDMVINQPMQGIWEDPAAWPKSGLASRGGNNYDHPTPPDNDRDDFNGGFWLARPSEDLFEALLKVRDYDDWDKEQGLMNKFFDRKGEHPWEKLDHAWNANYPNGEDIEYGIHALHEKTWQGARDWNDWIPRELTEFWRQKLGRMEGYWLGMEETRSP